MTLTAAAPTAPTAQPALTAVPDWFPDDLVRAFEMAMLKAFAQVRAATIAQLRLHAGPAPAAPPAAHATIVAAGDGPLVPFNPDSFDEEAWKAAVAANLGPQVEKAILAGANNALVGYSFDVYDPAMTAAVAEHIKAIQGWSPQLRSAVTGIVQTGMENGDSVDMVARRLSLPGSPISPDRAREIARTEMIAAANRGTLDGARVVGMQTKKWLATNDARTRPTHVAAHGQTVLIEGEFHVGGFALRYPGDPAAPVQERINCRCTLLFEGEGEPPATADARLEQDFPEAEGQTVDEVLANMWGEDIPHGPGRNAYDFGTPDKGGPPKYFPGGWKTLTPFGKRDIGFGPTDAYRPNIVKKTRPLTGPDSMFGVQENIGPPKYIYRAVSEDDWARIRKQGFLDSDTRGAIGGVKEGMNAEFEPVVSYLPRPRTGGQGRILRIRYDEADDWFVVPKADEYLRTTKQVPIGRIDLVSPKLVQDEKGLFTIVRGAPKEPAWLANYSALPDKVVVNVRSYTGPSLVKPQKWGKADAERFARDLGHQTGLTDEQLDGYANGATWHRTTYAGGTIHSPQDVRYYFSNPEQAEAARVYAFAKKGHPLSPQTVRQTSGWIYGDSPEALHQFDQLIERHLTATRWGTAAERKALNAAADSLRKNLDVDLPIQLLHTNPVAATTAIRTLDELNKVVPLPKGALSAIDQGTAEYGAAVRPTSRQLFLGYDFNTPKVTLSADVAARYSPLYTPEINFHATQIIHEYGHILHSLGGGGASPSAGLRGEAYDVLDRYIMAAAPAGRLAEREGIRLVGAEARLGQVARIEWLRDNLSQYAANSYAQGDSAEVVAEAFAEYMLRRQPRPVARQMMQWLFKRLGMTLPPPGAMLDALPKVGLVASVGTRWRGEYHSRWRTS